MLKTELRQQMRELKRQFTQQQLDELSLPIIERLRPRLHAATTVFAYYSLPDEVNTHQLVDELVAAGKTVFLPKVTGDDTMAWYRYTSKKLLERGAFGIQEPCVPNESYSKFSEFGDQIQCIYSPNSVNLLSNDTETVVLVPGIAFDVHGHRLGRGKGYYDRFLRMLESFPHVRKIGVCFDFQKVAEVPVDEHDMAVDEVI